MWFGTGFNAASDVFADHDRIVHHDARGQHEAEKDQAVQIGTAQPNDGKTADQGDRHAETRDQRQSPAPQKQHQHDEYQNH